jgi:hypothetical protein
MFFKIYCTAVVLCGLSISVQAYDDNVVKHCTDDYLAHCSAHDPDSVATRQCMEDHRRQLSKTCVRALAAANEIPRHYLQRTEVRRRERASSAN